MEYLIGGLALILLLWACSGSKKNTPEYRIEETADERYCEVVQNTTGKVVFVGERSQCEDWIENHR